jgi:hypothetical protein
LGVGIGHRQQALADQPVHEHATTRGVGNHIVEIADVHAVTLADASHRRLEPWRDHEPAIAEQHIEGVAPTPELAHRARPSHHLDGVVELDRRRS